MVKAQIAEALGRDASSENIETVYAVLKSRKLITNEELNDGVDLHAVISNTLGDTDLIAYILGKMA